MLLQGSSSSPTLTLSSIRLTSEHRSVAIVQLLAELVWPPAAPEASQLLRADPFGLSLPMRGCGGALLLAQTADLNVSTT